MKKLHSYLLFLPLALSTAFFTHIVKADTPKNQIDLEKRPNFSHVLKKVMPAVVNITIRGEIPTPPPIEANQPPQQRKFNERRGPSKFNSVGSGVIVDPKKGYIVTNAHLLKGAQTIVVVFSDGRKLRARQIGVDVPTDIAVLQIEPNKLTGIPLAKNTLNQVKVGDFVAAIGNPFGLDHTVTSGVVSALNRNGIIQRPGAYENFIQTDASINPGNSGGALINAKGELVGINTAIVGPISGNVGIGFAIPVDLVYPIMHQLIKYGTVKRGVLGISIQNFTPNLADAFNMPDVTGGALITKIKPDSAAEKAGLKAKDVILQMNQTPIKNAAQLSALIAVLPAGTTIELLVRQNEKTKKVKVGIEERNQLEKKEIIAQKNPLMGMQLQNYDAYSPETGELKGVEVTYVDDNSDAWIAGLRPGDIILSAYGESVENINNLIKLVKKNDKKPLLVNIWRAGGTLFTVIP
jgi:serine protease Do